MINKTENIYKKLLNIDHSSLSNGKVGLEKESLRIRNNLISKSRHHKELGSPLFNQFITTDFSESLLEFITPPSQDKIQNLKFLDDIHHYVLSIIGDEYFWPLSMPLNVSSSDDIVIAEYGDSNPAILKRKYREGLAIRYGRQMQAISGLHFNYSFTNSYLESEYFPLKSNIQLSKSEKYLSCSRNILRLNWMILYLYGASPIIPNSLLINKNDDFLLLDDNYSYLPNATSLRMSDIGYQSHKQSNLFVSYNSLDSYIKDLYDATNTFSDDFYNLAKKSKEGLQQLSPNILQIEDEYYSASRPKSSSDSKQRTLTKLKKGGIDYLEFRSLDLNPFCRSGIDIQTIYFLEVFLLYCSILDSPKISKDESSEIKNNDLIVAKKGRKKKLMLNRNKKSILLSDWLSQILDEMMIIAETIDTGYLGYIEAIDAARNRLKFPENTLSAMVLDNIISDKQSFEEFGFNMGNQHKKDFIKYRNNSIRAIEEEIELSINKQVSIENKDEESFDEFLNNYLNTD